MTTKPRVRHRSRDSNGASTIPRDAGQDGTSPDGKKASPANTRPATRAQSPADTYEIGYGKPPERTRFKPGQSGNPRGRPRGSRQLKTLVAQQLSSKVTVREGNATKSVSKREALAMQIVKKSLEGNDRAIQTVLKIDEDLAAALKAQASDQAASAAAAALDDCEQAILEQREKRLRDKWLSERHADIAPKVGAQGSEDDQ